MQYFEHSTTSASDSKILRLRLEEGGAAVDAYWYIIEQIHREERPFCFIEAIMVHSHTLCTDEDTLCRWVEAMKRVGLIDADDDGCLVSERALSNVERYHERSEKARKAVAKRWGNTEKINDGTDEIRPHIKRNSNALATKQNKTKQRRLRDRARKTPPAYNGEASDGTPTAGTCPECGEGLQLKSGLLWCRCGARRPRGGDQ